MSVLKNLRNLSNMQFYKTALFIRKELSEWMLREFGTTRNKKSVRQVIKDITPEDQKTIDEIFIKYGRSTNKEYQGEYPEWFMDHERDTILKVLQELMENIVRANTLYVQKGNRTEYEQRRLYQDRAIGCCYVLYSELQYIRSLFATDLNKYVEILESIEKEVDLLKGWRMSDNKNSG